MLSVDQKVTRSVALRLAIAGVSQKLPVPSRDDVPYSGSLTGWP
jgi:hypothetical protein